MRTIAYVLFGSLLLACVAPPPSEPFDAKATSVLTAETNGVVVQLQRAGIGVVPLRYLGEPALSNDDFLTVTFTIGISDSGRKVDYDGWASSSARLTDNLGNSYRLIDFGFGASIDRQLKSATVYADQHASDRLVFQRPVPAAEKLQLELPASHVGGTGTLRFRFDVPRPEPQQAKPAAKSKPTKTLPAAPPPDPERRAAQKLEFARALVADKKHARARDRLKEIITEFPDTKAAAEAKPILDSLPPT